MKKLLTTLFLVLILGVLPAWASMDTELEVLGFSENGAYIAYQISGFGTGSGIGFSMIQIVDVFANDFAMDDFVVEAELVDQSMEELKAAVFAQARTALAGFGILAENSGSLVYELQGKTSWEQLRRTRKTVSLVMDDALGYRRNYELVLEEREVTADYCRNLQDYNLEPRIFTLILRGEDFSQVLQEDRVLYRSRHCPYAYEIYRVYANGERIAVFLNARTVGWEGDDVYKLVVTGALDR